MDEWFDVILYKFKTAKEVDMARLKSKSTTGAIWVPTIIVIATAIMVLTTLKDGAAEEYKMAGAISAEPDEMLGKAWRLFHDRANRSDARERISEAARLLRMREGNGSKVSEDTFNTSFAYRLLVAKMPGSYGNNPGEAPASNVALRHFEAGVRYFYRQQNIPARMAFARGIFTTAQLEKSDYKALQGLGVNVQYDKGATLEVNAANLADIFIGADLNKKEKMLRVIADKFSGVKANNAATDWNHPAYHVKGVYWNLGFFISAHWLVGNSSSPDDKKTMQEAVDMRDTNGWAYNTLLLKFKYHTCDDSML